MRADEWAQELAETLAHGWGGLATMTVAACANAAASEVVIATARKTVEAAGWDLYVIDARWTVGDPSLLQDAGYVILRDIRVPLREEVVVLIGAFQHLVQRSLPVGMLAVGSPAGIRALRRHPGMGFLSRAESVIQD
ncbi:hypothetical protein [Arthrobacter sp. 131MFCol6.1]|uniref:hypothetical protein n=1 Tax=Arthrobacter sp. 131MFCol6.1 TaxID=1157944 RepID=UPI00036B3DC6|nr:hypothetical protein [Arthrobacter sp. 131MFCol6.1]